MSKVVTAELVEEKLTDILPDINTKYAYVLAQENEKRGRVYDENGVARDEVKHKPYLNVILRSSIVWDGREDPFSGKPRAKGRQGIRYYDGCTTLFMDDQPKEKETIDSLLGATREVVFNHGYLFIYGYDALLKVYLDWCSYNEDSAFRIPNSPAKFKMVNSEKESQQDEALLELEDKARDLAKNAPVKKMRIHAAYLGLPFIDAITGHDLSESAIRTEYRKEAKRMPKRFVESYNDKTIEVSTWIADALSTGKISTKKRPNSALLMPGEVFLCDISGLKDNDLIIQKLVELTQTEEGSDLLAQLKSLYS